MKNVILFVCLIWVLGCATEEEAWTPIRQAFDEGAVSEVVLAKVEQGICGSGCDPNDPQAYAECIANECGGDGPGNGGGGSGGGGGATPYDLVCTEYNSQGTRTCCYVADTGLTLSCYIVGGAPCNSMSCPPPP